MGEANAVANNMRADPARLPVIVAGLDDPDLVVRMRAADVADNVSAVHLDGLAPHKVALLRRK